MTDDLTLPGENEKDTAGFQKACNFYLPVILMTVVLLISFRDVLFSQRYSAMHDTIKTYPFFHFFVQNIHNGIFPLWSPYTHCGEPFWAYIQITGLSNPVITLLSVMSAVFRINDISFLFHLYIFLSIIVFNIGTALTARHILKACDREHYLWIIIPIIFFGTFTCASWAQIFGTVVIAAYFPLIIFLFLKLFDSLRETSVKAVLWRCLVIGIVISVQLSTGNPAFFSFSLGLFLLLYGLNYFLFESGKDLQVFKKYVLALFVVAVFAVLFSGPMFMLAAKQKSFLPIARLQSVRGAKVSYSAGFSPRQKRFKTDIGTPARIKDLVKSIDFSGRLKTSEIPLLFGAAGFFFLLAGFFPVLKRWYLLFVSYFVFICILSLGARMKLSLLLYNYCPGFSLMRHLEFFMPYAFFAGILMITTGCIRPVDFCVSKFEPGRIKLALTGLIVILSFISSYMGFAGNLRDNIRDIPPFMKKEFPYKGDIFNWNREHKVEPFKAENMFRDRSASYGEPLIQYKDSVRFFDNATQFMMPLKFSIFYYGKKENKRELAGITRKKILFPDMSDGEQDIQVLSFNANMLEFETEANTSGRLFVSQNSMDGWRVYVNGEQVKTAAKSEHPFFELDVPEGKNSILFQYMPMDIIIAYITHYLGQSVLFGLIFYSGFISIISKRKPAGT